MTPPSVLEAMQEVRAEWRLEDYLRFLRQHWRWILLWGVAGWMAGFGVAHRLPNIYEARARLLIERYAAEPVRFAEVTPSAALRDYEFLATEYQLITSRPVAEQVLRELNLAGFPPFSFSSDPAAALAGMIRVQPIRATKLADIAVASTNPALAMRIANTTAHVYTQLNLERRRRQMTGGADWLREEVLRAEREMKAAQEALQRFKEEHQMVSLEDRQNVVVQRLREISSAATDAKTARLNAEAELSEIERNLAAGIPTESLPVVQQNDLIKELKGKITGREADLADHLKIYGERHPVILQFGAEIESLKGQLHVEAQKVVEAIRLEYAAARAREQELQAALTEQERLALDLNRLELDYNNLSRQTKASADLYDSLNKRLKELEVTESLQTNNVRVVDEAKLPERPIAPNRLRIIGLWAFFGLLAGGVTAFLRETLTTTIRSRKDLEELLNLPFLGRVLRVASASGRHSQEHLFFVKHPDSVAAEGIRAIRTTLEFLLPEAPVHRLLVTSSLPEEGKSLASANLAVSLQELGRRVILIDADMRRPSLFRIFQIPLEPGLSTYLQNQASLEDIVQVPSGTHGLTVISSGALPPRPTDLLAGPRMAALIEELSASFQYIIVDTPPTLAVADATILSRLIDCALLVARANQTTRDAILAARQQLAQTPLKFLATLLNDLRPHTEMGYHYGYYYQHYGRGAKRRRSRKARRWWGTRGREPAGIEEAPETAAEG